LDVVKDSYNEEHDDYINDFIHIGKSIWDIMSYFNFDGDTISDINDDSRIKNVELFTLENTSMRIVDL
jgi:hypothetical protein